MKTRIRQCNSGKENAPPETTRGVPPTLEEIRQHAHEICTARGGAAGKELEDWLRAEQQLKQERAGANMGTTR
jgi:hypothetical protein